MRWEEVAFAGTDERLVAAPIKGKGNGDGATLHDYLRLLERERSANEDRRSLYVAATRAIRALHLVGVARPRGDGTLAPPAGTFLELLWPAAAGAFEAAPLQDAVAEAGDAAAFEPRLLRLAEPAGPEFLQGEAVPEPQPPAEAAGDGSGGDAALAADVGTLVHAYLEMIARDGVASWPLSRIEALVPAMRVWLGQQGHAEAAARGGAREVQLALRATLESVAGRWVLGVHDEAAAEWALSVAEGEGVATHVIDRSFVADGARWIIDYKTVKVGTPGVLPAGRTGLGLRAHAERYRGQLERYAALFRDEGLPVRIAVFYAATGDLLELPLPGS
jgi:ATP-dependent exoDNAse (exonuclease V) beta subunit